MSALLSAADSTQMETERDMQSVEKEYEKMDYKLRKAADEEATFTAKLRTEVGVTTTRARCTSSNETNSAPCEGNSRKRSTR